MSVGRLPRETYEGKGEGKKIRETVIFVRPLAH